MLAKGEHPPGSKAMPGDHFAFVPAKTEVFIATD